MAVVNPNASLKVPVGQELRLYYLVQDKGSFKRKGKKKNLSVSLSCGVLDEIASLRMTIVVLWPVEKDPSQLRCFERVGRWLDAC